MNSTMDFSEIYIRARKLSSSKLLHRFGLKRRSFYTSVSLFLLLLTAYNSASVFSTRIQVPVSSSLEPGKSLPENVAQKQRELVSASRKISSSVMFAVEEVSPVAKTLKQESPVAGTVSNLNLPHKNGVLEIVGNVSMVYHPKRRRRRLKTLKKFVGSEDRNKLFSTRIKEFFSDKSSNDSCKLRFFMTWISSVESFGERELLSMESLFRIHPDGCLVIISKSMDSSQGRNILRPFLDKGLKVTAIAPDFHYLFKNTVAQAWLDQLVKGNVNPGEISLGQNLSNLVRLGLLYKFGGIYLDTDVIVLKSFDGFKNVIGAQTIDAESKNWSRLNNAVMIFEKGHPLVYKFIEEFALTFDGNRWGHNGPYLVSRVVSRVSGREGYNFTVLPPMAFYPVDWSRIGSLFRGPRNLPHSKWLVAKLGQIQKHSFAIHLWNRQSRRFTIQKGSIIQHILSRSCIFCNSSLSNL